MLDNASGIWYYAILLSLGTPTARLGATDPLISAALSSDDNILDRVRVKSQLKLTLIF